ncbi:PAS domain-containing protein [Novosphingobium malaysiense]|uniref:PAS domain-containing protein n=1 Tax=Novosphingobium malaysiense TaxID=1348853 RepID=A0A0B1ZRD2_9SPHN|nr:PAS domain-containing protein [Novosphingobium malaysiense]KHK93116.1 hypothetical protein LK12_01835 [Novosphingobium malaysiense]
MPASIATDDFKGALAHAPIGAMIVDAAGAVSWANDAASAMMGTAASADLEDFPLTLRLSAQDAATLRRMLALHFGAPVSKRTTRDASLALPRQSGTCRPALWTLAPLEEGDGRHAVLFLQDVSDEISADPGMPLYFRGELVHLAPCSRRSRPAKGPAFLERLGGGPTGAV